jgi:hypothetical protein
MSEPHRCPVSLSFSLAHRLLPPGPSPPRSCPSATPPRRPLLPPAPVRAAMAPPAPNGRGPLPATPTYPPPCQAPLSSFSLLHADAPTPTPLFPSLPHATEPLFKSDGSRPIPVLPHSLLVPARATRAECHLPEPTFPIALRLGFGRRHLSPPFPGCAALRASPLPIHGPHSPLSLPLTYRVCRRSSGTTEGRCCHRSTVEPKLLLRLDVATPVR